jgi:hypothetical protein
VLFHLVLLWNCAVLCGHKFPITDLTRLFNDKCGPLNDFEFVFPSTGTNVAYRKPVNQSSATRSGQEIKIPTVKNVLRPRRKLRHGGELIFLHRKLCGSLESRRGVVAGKVHCKTSRSALATAAQISNEIRFARGSLDN